VHSIATDYTHGDMDAALWHFDLCSFLALQPAALEAAGMLPESEHYAIRAGLRAGDKARAEFLQGRAK
jgi:hypothetical protein